MTSIGIYHGDEEWVLKGIGRDIGKALSSSGNFSIETTDQVFKGARLNTDFHVFVQQGQLNSNCKNNKQLVPSGAICLFTHLDVGNFRPDILANCKAVIFNSSIQLSMAIANGYIPSNAYLQPHAVDPSIHTILSDNDPGLLQVLGQLQASGRKLTSHSAVGFCGRYWDKYTYTRRKNYEKVKAVASTLISEGIPVIVLGPGWDNVFTKKNSLLSLVEAKYKYYPFVYNLMKIFVSLSVHEGGPLPVLESMCCGAYPIVTNTGFAFDVIKDRSHGTLVDAFQSPDFYSNIIKKQFASDQLDVELIRRQASKFSFSKLASLISRICQA